MADNRDVLYLPGSRVDGLGLGHARRELSRVRAQRPDRGAGDQATGQGRNRPRPAARKARPTDGREGGKGGSRVVSALVQMQIVQLLVVLGAIVAAWVAYRLGWF